MKKRIWSVILVICLFVSFISLPNKVIAKDCTSATAKIDEIKNQPGFTTNSSYGDGGCWRFVNAFCNAFYGTSAPGGVSGYRLSNNGDYGLVETLSVASKNLSTESVKSLLLKAYPGDIIQICSKNIAEVNHTAIVENVSNDGITIYEHIDPEYGGVRSKYRSWSEFFSTYARFNRDCDGISLYHYNKYPYKDSNSDPISTPTPSTPTPNPKPSQSSLSVNITAGPPNNHPVGKAHLLAANIQSNCKITKIEAELVNADNGSRICSKVVYPDSYLYYIGNEAIDYAMRFDNISKAGNYRVTIKAYDESSKSVSATHNFTTGVVTYPPNLSASDLDEGKRVTASYSDNNALIHFNVNSWDEKTGYGSITRDFLTAGTYNISAWTTKSGSESSRKNETYYVTKMSTPSISAPSFGNSSAMVTISGSGRIYYTTNGSNPTKSSSQYTGPIYLTNSATVKAISVQTGCQTSNIAERYENITPPDTPTVSLYNTKPKIAQGRTATVSWNRTDRATSYTAYLYYNGDCVNTYETTGTYASFKLTEVGDYTINVKANNFKGQSGESNSAVVSSMAPVKVSFVDRISRSGEVTDSTVADVQMRLDNKYGEETERIEGNVIAVQKIDYDTVPVKPEVPSKTGFTFTGYSDGLYKEALCDTTVYVDYSINYYQVDFFDLISGNKLSSREVMYTSEAPQPTDYSNPDGYVFTGWSVENSKSDCFDYKFVDGKMTLYSAYAWSNEELPVFANFTALECKGTSYLATIGVKNYPVKDTQARVIIALETDKGKIVYTQVADIDLDLGTVHDDYQNFDIRLNCSDRITTASAYVVGCYRDSDTATYRTGGALSEKVSISDITYADNMKVLGEYSEWSPTYTAGDSVETKIQYSYRDKSTTTSTSRTLSGWNYSHRTEKVGSWSGWLSYYVGAFENDLQKREVQYSSSAPSYKTQYLYWGYKGANGWYHFCEQQGERYWGCNFWYIDSGWRDSTIPWYSQSTQYCTVHGDSSSGYYREYSGAPWYYWATTRQVETSPGYTLYNYRDTYYTHHFYKYSNWSEYSDAPVSATSTREVRTRTMYRYANLEYDPDKDPRTESPLHEVIERSGNIDNVGTEYVTETEYNDGNYNLILGPYFKNDDGEYIDVDECDHTVAQCRYGRYTNGTYTLPCLECAEEIYGGEWKEEYTDWVNAVDSQATVENNVYECAEAGHNHEDCASEADGVYYWNEYLIGDESYCFMETREVERDVSFADKNKYYLVNANLEGQLATVMVYRKTNTDPTEQQIEYIDQVTIGENNSYSFTAKTKDILDYAETGDFVISLGIEGSSRLVNIGIIEAPLPKHTVDFYVNGELFRSVEIEEGNAVDVNEIGIPELEGYRFVNWDKSVTNIRKNLSVNAVFTQKEYAVVFVDHENETAELSMLKYGSVFEAPVVEDVDGMTFIGWDGITDGEDNTVTDSRVITAVWEPVKYEVKFYDFDKNIVSEQLVNYGDAAELPENVIKDGISYQWEIMGGTWWNVTQNMSVYPYVPQSEDLIMPYTSISTEDTMGQFSVDLNTLCENGKIFYTVDTEITDEDARAFVNNNQAEIAGDTEALNLMSTSEISLFAEDSEIEEPIVSDVISEYTEPIQVWAGSTVFAFAVDENGNISPISIFYYKRADIDDDAGSRPNEYVPNETEPQITMPTIMANPGDTITVPVTLKNNPGLKNLLFYIGYDSENLELVSVTNGNVFHNSEFSYDSRTEGSCKMEWLTDAENSTDGNLMTMVFKTNEAAKTNTYLIDISVEESQNSEGEGEYLVAVPGAVDNKSDNDIIFGDVNGDGDVDFADAVILLRYDVGFYELLDAQKKISDANKDGAVDFADAIKLLRFDAGFISTLK